MLETITDMIFNVLQSGKEIIQSFLEGFGFPIDLIFLALAFILAFWADKKFNRTYWVFTGIVLFLLLLRL